MLAFDDRHTVRNCCHGGNQSSVAFADPKHKLAAALIFNGTPGDAEHDQRLRSALTTLYENFPAI